MKIQPRQASAFIKKPPPKIKAVLFYGPNGGLVREYSQRLRLNLGTELQDPFCSSEITSQVIKENPGALMDEFLTMTLSGARRVIRLVDADDSITTSIIPILNITDASQLGFIALEAGDLGPRSKLRKLFEGSDFGASLACYSDESHDALQLAQLMFKKHNITVSEEALTWLTSCLGGDRGQTVNEINKIVMFASTDGSIDLEEMQSLVGDAAEISLNTIAMAVANGDANLTDTSVHKALNEGIMPIQILRAVNKHFLRIQLAGSRYLSGETADQAIKSLRPPVFFKHKAEMINQVRNWTLERIGQVLLLLAETEKNCKISSASPATLCSRTLLKATAGAKKLPK